MKKLLIGFSFFLVLSLLATPIFAETDGTETAVSDVVETDETGAAASEDSAQTDFSNEDSADVPKKSRSRRQIDEYKGRLRDGNVSDYAKKLRKRGQDNVEIERNKLDRKAAREEFRGKVKEIRDEKKKQLLEKIDERIVAVNTRWVNHANSVMERLNVLLAKIEARAEKLEAKGKDVAAVHDAVARAEEVVSNAQAVISEQAAKDYVIEVGDDSTLGQDARSALSALRSDLTETKAVVKEAKEAVRAAFGVLKSLRGDTEAE